MSNLAALAEGTVLVGDYRIERVLGAGGFGITYLAEEIALARKVTIKEYFPYDYAARGGDAEVQPRSQFCTGDYQWGLDRFIEEAQTLARFNHPHIVRVYRYFRANNTGYMVLHFEEGQSFKGWLKGLGRAPRQKELDRIIEPLLEALDIIHASDFLHRDIAPDNIIIRNDGAPVLIDFGAARGEIAAHSKTVSALVKPGYSPYEQYAETSRQQGPWTDIYALAATLYHAVSGRRPPDAPSRMVADEIVPAREAALSAYRLRFLKAIDTGLSVAVDARPRSVAAWRGELLAPDPPRGGWLSGGKPRKAPGDDDIPPRAQSSPGAGDGPPIPPAPDAPGPQGGMLDFVDKLKKSKQSKQPKPQKTRPLEAALAGVGAAAGGPGGDLPSLPGADSIPPTETVVPPAAAPAPEPPRRASEPLAAGTEASPSPLFPPMKRRTIFSRPRVPAVPAAAGLPVPVPAERRKPPRPRAHRGGGASAVAAILFWLVFVIVLAGAALVARDHLPTLGGPFYAALQERISAVIPDRNGELGRSPASSPGGAAGSRDTGRETREPDREPPPAVNPLALQISGHDGPVSAVAYADAGRRIVSTGDDATLKVWQASDGRLERMIAMDHGPATTVAVRDSVAATGHADGFVSLWDLDSGLKLGDFRRNEASIWAVAFTSLPGRIAAASHDWKVTLWDRNAPGTPLHVFDGHENAVQALSYSPAGTHLVSGGADRRVMLWNLDTLDRLRTYSRHGDFVTALDFTRDGKLFAAGELSGEIRLWSTSSLRLRHRLRAHKGAITAVAFSPDGRLVASASADGTARLWSVARGRTLRTFASHAGRVSSAAFSPDGAHVVTAGDDGKLRIWNVAAARP